MMSCKLLIYRGLHVVNIRVIIGSTELGDITHLFLELVRAGQLGLARLEQKPKYMSSNTIQ